MISDSILQTLAYSDHFGFSLTLSELSVRLIQSSCTKTQLTEAISDLITQKKIEKQGNTIIFLVTEICGTSQGK